ncbi:MAG: hypothetical protein JRI43_03130, partial [Deltaproteobacteria bacterium]|nr:hypothetical protein [Deltaproteobacteria bacterium]
NEFLRDKGLLRKGFLQKQIVLTVGDRTLTLLVSINMLHDDQGRNSGMVAVFEDLSEIEKAQRVAAWREVAKRIAHEVKNPLTPIQLSAQRLKRKYGHKVEEEGSNVFEECTDMIINQAEAPCRRVFQLRPHAHLQSCPGQYQPDRQGSCWFLYGGTEQREGNI